MHVVSTARSIVQGAGETEQYLWTAIIIAMAPSHARVVVTIAAATEPKCGTRIKCAMSANGKSGPVKTNGKRGYPAAVRTVVVTEIRIMPSAAKLSSATMLPAGEND